MDSEKRNTYLLNLSFIFFLIDVFLLSWWGANSQIEYVLPTFAFSFLAILPLCFMGGQSFYNKFEKVIFFSGVYLIAYALIGYLNPSMEFLKNLDYTFLRELQHLDYLPTSVKSPIIYNNALTSVMKISSVFFIVMFAIKVFRRQNYTNFAMNFLAVNGTLVAIFGIVQKKMAFAGVYDYFLSDSDFYATFFLSSASGAFINLTLALNLALVYYSTKNKRIFRVALFIIFAGLCIYSSKLTGSHGAIMLSIATCVMAVIVAIFAGFNKVMRPRYSLLCTICYLAFIGFIFFITTSISKTESLKKESLDGRFGIYQTSLRVIEKYPLFGVGGEGTRYVLPTESYLVQLENNKKYSAVPARAHMDILEYFIEFGFLGAWVIVLSFFAYIFKFLSKIKYLTPENAILFFGVMLCITHSMWDLVLHFQSVMIYMGIIAILSLNRIARRDDEI